MVSACYFKKKKNEESNFWHWHLQLPDQKINAGVPWVHSWTRRKVKVTELWDQADIRTNLKKTMQLSSITARELSLVMLVSRNPTHLSMIDIYENDLKGGVRLVFFCCLLFPGLKGKSFWGVRCCTANLQASVKGALSLNSYLSFTDDWTVKMLVLSSITYSFAVLPFPPQICHFLHHD